MQQAKRLFPCSLGKFPVRRYEDSWCFWINIWRYLNFNKNQLNIRWVVLRTMCYHFGLCALYIISGDNDTRGGKEWTKTYLIVKCLLPLDYAYNELTGDNQCEKSCTPIGFGNQWLFTILCESLVENPFTGKFVINQVVRKLAMARNIKNDSQCKSYNDVLAYWQELH